MRIFVAAMVAVFGVAMFAVAALVWDRRRQLVGTPDQPGVLLRIGAPRGASGPPDESSPGGRRYLPHVVVLGVTLLGIVMIVGSCAGLLRF